MSSKNFQYKNRHYRHKYLLMSGKKGQTAKRKNPARPYALRDLASFV